LTVSSQAVVAGQTESEATRRFIETVKRLSGGEDVMSCMQCGTCSGSCPLARHMRYTPRRLIEMIRAGLIREVLAADTFWYCASCYSCAVRCPRGISITNLMYALKSLAMQQASGRSPAFYKGFCSVVRRFGRMSEPMLLAEMGFRANPLPLIGYAPFGLKLMSRGKVGLVPVRIKGTREVQAIWRKAVELEGGGS